MSCICDWRIAAYASYSNHTGTLIPGKRFDAVIWDDDLMTVDQSEMLDVIVKATLLDGQLVFGSISAWDRVETTTVILRLIIYIVEFSIKIIKRTCTLCLMCILKGHALRNAMKCPWYEKMLTMLQHEMLWMLQHNMRRSYKMLAEATKLYTTGILVHTETDHLTLRSWSRHLPIGI
jgi:hypothetical protein